MDSTPELPPQSEDAPSSNLRRLLVVSVITLVAIGVGGLAVGAVRGAFRKMRDTSKYKAMLPRQPAAALDQFYLENPDRIFINYGDLFGPDRYIKAYHQVDGGDISFQFPIRRQMHDPLPVRLPDGTTVTRFEVLAVIAPSGLISTYPRPQDSAHDPDRVYQLETGQRYRGWYLTDEPPDPAGREGRDQDGVHVVQLPGGRRYEITYRGGVPDGPFRAFYENGKPWGEATYQKGKVVEAWLIGRDGRRYNELKGEAPP